jgi:hypothetical protein
MNIVENAAIAVLKPIRNLRWKIAGTLFLITAVNLLTARTV